MLNVSLLISTAHSSAQPEVHKQPPWSLASTPPSCLGKPDPVATQPSGLATWWVPSALRDLTQRAPSLAFCLGCWSTTRTAEVGNGERPYIRWLTRALGTVPASDLHSLVKSSARLCSIVLICPLRSSRHPYPFCYVPQEAICHRLRQVFP